ncbi:MAG: fatty acid desaturase [Paracoccaceae bacterium]|jgi:fatty acid desaturase
MTPGKKYLTSEEIRPLAARSDFMGGLMLLHCFGWIALALAVFSFWPNPLTFVLAVGLIGSRQLGLAILMHDGAHRALFKTGWLNEFVGTWVCGNLILADMATYRHYHLTHHRFTQSDKDPDIVLSKPFPTTRASLMRKFIRDLTGRTGLRQLGGQVVLWFKMAGDTDAVNEADKQAQAFKGGGPVGAVLANGAIFIVMALVGEWWWWFAFWLLPLMTWFQLVLRIRNIAEHALTEYSDDPFKNVRTTLADPITTLFLAPYWVNYHLEHHLIMHVPCWNLKKMHTLMIAKGHGQAMNVAPNYWGVLWAVGWKNRVA